MIEDVKCRKCDSTVFFIKQKGNNTGLYCGGCGTWQKWLNKDEVNLWKYHLETLVVDEQRPKEEIKVYMDTNASSTCNESIIIERLNRLVSWINKEIDNEKELQIMVSNLDKVRSLSYRFGLLQVKLGIENILNGCEYDYDGE